MKYNAEQRAQIIEVLILDDLELTQDPLNGENWLKSTLRYGHKGYINFTDNELRAEYNTRDFPETI